MLYKNAFIYFINIYTRAKFSISDAIKLSAFIFGDRQQVIQN